jgi:hypothetical protein
MVHDCKQQQAEIKQLEENLGMPDNLVIVSMDVDSNEDGALIQQHAEMNDLNWSFTIKPQDAAREISQLYGAQYLNRLLPLC